MLDLLLFTIRNLIYNLYKITSRRLCPQKVGVEEYVFQNRGVPCNSRLQELVWCAEVAICGRLLVVSVRLLVVCSRLLVVCHHLWWFVVVWGRLWPFVVVAWFSNYGKTERLLQVGKKLSKGIRLSEGPVTIP